MGEMRLWQGRGLRSDTATLIASSIIRRLASDIAHHREIGTPTKAALLVQLQDAYDVLDCEAAAKQEDRGICIERNRQMMSDVEDEGEYLKPHMEAYDRDDPGRKYARKLRESDKSG